MRLDHRYLREFIDEDGEIKIEINFVNYVMTAIFDSGKFHLIMNPADKYAPSYMISYDDLREELARIFKKEEDGDE